MSLQKTDVLHVTAFLNFQELQLCITLDERFHGMRIHSDEAKKVAAIAATTVGEGYLVNVIEEDTKKMDVVAKKKNINLQLEKSRKWEKLCGEGLEQKIHPRISRESISCLLHNAS